MIMVEWKGDTMSENLSGIHWEFNVDVDMNQTICGGRLKWTDAHNNRAAGQKPHSSQAHNTKRQRHERGWNDQRDPKSQKMAAKEPKARSCKRSQEAWTQLRKPRKWIRNSATFCQFSPVRIWLTCSTLSRLSRLAGGPWQKACVDNCSSDWPMRLFSTVRISVELKCLFPNASKAMQNLKRLKLITPKAWTLYDDECLYRVEKYMEKQREAWQTWWIGFEKHWVGSANRRDFAALQPLGTLVKARLQLCDQLLLGIYGQFIGKCLTLLIHNTNPKQTGDHERFLDSPFDVAWYRSHARRCAHVISWSTAKERPRHWRLDWALALRKDSVLAHLAPRRSMQRWCLGIFKHLQTSVANLWRLCKPNSLVWPGPGIKAKLPEGLQAGPSANRRAYRHGSQRLLKCSWHKNGGNHASAKAAHIGLKTIPISHCNLKACTFAAGNDWCYILCKKNRWIQVSCTLAWSGKPSLKAFQGTTRVPTNNRIRHIGQRNCSAVADLCFLLLGKNLGEKSETENWIQLAHSSCPSWNILEQWCRDAHCLPLPLSLQFWHARYCICQRTWTGNDTSFKTLSK